MSTDFRLVRHGPDGGRALVAEPITLPAADASEINVALVRTPYRLYPITVLAPLRNPTTHGEDDGVSDG